MSATLRFATSTVATTPLSRPRDRAHAQVEHDSKPIGTKHSVTEVLAQALVDLDSAHVAAF